MGHMWTGELALGVFLFLRGRVADWEGGICRPHSPLGNLSTCVELSSKHTFAMCLCACVLSHFSWLSVTLGTVTRFLCPWDSPGKNAGVGCHALLRGSFLTQGWKLRLLWLLHRRQILCPWATGEAPIRAYCMPDPESGSGGMKKVRRHAMGSSSGCTFYNPKGHRIVYALSSVPADAGRWLEDDRLAVMSVRHSFCPQWDHHPADSRAVRH